jgi:hypothetical protein
VSVRERSKEKEKESEKKEKPREEPEEEVVTKKSSVQQVPEITVKEDVSVSEGQEERTVPEEVTVEPQEILPPWGSAEDSEWMYQVPDREEDREMWAEEWSDFILGWMESQGIHVISITTFITERPFTDIVGKTDAFKVLGDRLVEDDVAQWVGEEKRQLRVYWRPLEDWADHIYRWALETGSMRLDVKSIVIQQGREGFGRLPEEDLHRIMELLIERGYARWVDKERGAVVLVI